MRILHVMIRVKSLETSLRFYCSTLGMQLIRQSVNQAGSYATAFLGYGRNPEHAEIELTENFGCSGYELGTAYGHLAIGVPDIYQVCKDIQSKGGQITRQPGPVKGGQTVIAFVEDPDGYKIELIERRELPAAVSTDCASKQA